jgi:signal transduction histidine kinase
MSALSHLKSRFSFVSGPNGRETWVRHLPLAGILAALIVFTLIDANSIHSINSLQDRATWVDHTYQVLSTMEETFSVLKDVRSSARSYVLSGNPKLLDAFQLYNSDVTAKVTLLRKLTSDNPAQLQKIAVLERQTNDYVMFLEDGIKLRQSNSDSSVALAYLANGKGESLMSQIRDQIGLMQQEENRLLAKRSVVVEHTAHETKLLIVFGTIATYLMVGYVFALLAREIRQRQFAQQAVDEANGKLTRHAIQLEVTNKELESFSYSISHDLRIPLRAVAGYARMLEEDYADKLDSEGQRLLNVIRDNSKRMGELIDDLLAFSRLGRKEISATHVDMTALVTHVIEDLQRNGDYRDRRIDVNPLPEAWGDRTLLQQVWINLISNALKYSSTSEQPVVQISATMEENEVIYSVSDNGVGFDMQYYDKLFGVFQRLHSAEEFPGTGVGLAIVQRIIVRHSGRVWAHGEVGKGAVFSFALPRKGEINA